MNIQKFNPQSVLNNFLDEVLNTNIGEFMGSDLLSTNPGVNIKETEESYHIELAAPGLEKSDFKITLDGNYMVVSANKENLKEEGDKDSYTRREYSFAKFERKFPLPSNINREKIDAEYKNGILTVALAKMEKDVKKSITIDVG